MDVIVPCMSWVPICWRDLLGLFYKNNQGMDADKSFSNYETVIDNFVIPDLPNPIIEDILSRLPLKCIRECQRQSKALHAFTKTSYFAQMQRNRFNSVTVVQPFPDPPGCEYDSIKLYFIDEESRNIERKTVDICSSYKRKNNRVSIAGSYDGFLIFTNLYAYSGWMDSVYYLWNPVTNEKRTWYFADKHIQYVCGFYFCPLRRDYVLLLASDIGPRYEVQIFNMRTEATENVVHCSYPPSRGKPPVIINRTLYWMVDQILYECIHADWPSHSNLIVSFEMETERFIAVGHNGRIGKSLGHGNMSLHLFDLEGELCICDRISWTELELSVLNYKTKCWVKRHNVILPECGFVRFDGMEVVNYKKRELLVRQKNRLYSYNLQSCMYRIVEIGFADHAFQATVHVDSLVSFGGGDIIFN